MLILLLGVIVRTWALTTIPASLNIDEQALGYNAYSLFKTGLDEYGKFFSISLESFGDWKLIGYPLITIPFIAFLGLSDLSVRLPSAVAGILQVIFIYFFACKLFRNKKIALFSSLLLAISPWSIYFSRMAYEVNVATTYFLGGLLAYIVYVENQRKKYFFILACLLFAATMFTYHSFVIFTPIFCVLFFFLERKKIQKNNFFFVGFFILALACFFVLRSVMVSSSGKLSTLAVWNDANVIYSRSDSFRTDGSNDKMLGRIFYSRPFATLYQIGENYLSTFSPTFLFDKGGEKLVNSLGYFGNFYLLDAIFLILGVVFVIQAKIQHKSLLLLWLLLGIIPSAVTKDAPSATRLFMLLPLLVIICACGIIYLLQVVKRDLFGRIVLCFFVLGYMANILFFFDSYFLHVNYQRGLFLHYGYKQAVLLSERFPQDTVVMVGPDNFPYISFLFYTQYDPGKFRKEVIYYPKNHASFIEVKQFGKYHFVDSIDYERIMPQTLYIDNKSFNQKNMLITLPNGKPLFQYFFKTK